MARRNLGAKEIDRIKAHRAAWRPGGPANRPQLATKSFG